MGENKEYISQPDEMGSINISEDVIAIIAAVAATEVEGVGSLSSGIGTDIAELLGKKNMSRGIKVSLDSDTVSVEVFLLIKYGCTIPEVAKNVQDAVYGAVEAMTGLTVVAVNVHVAGIVFDKETK